MATFTIVARRAVLFTPVQTLFMFYWGAPAFVPRECAKRVVAPFLVLASVQEERHFQQFFGDLEQRLLLPFHFDLGFRHRGCQRFSQMFESGLPF